MLPRVVEVAVSSDGKSRKTKISVKLVYSFADQGKYCSGIEVVWSRNKNVPELG
jgi:hypothetical protein